MSFDLEKSIAAWRRFYEINPAFSSEDIEELENGLRDRIDAIMSRNKPAQEAFQIAIKRVGSPGNAEREYKKVYWGKVRREGRLKDALVWRLSMFKNYLKVALRNLRKQPGHTTTNIVGLSIGLACFLMIGLYVRFELSYDRFHERANRIYRIVWEDPGGDYLGNNVWTRTPGGLLTALIEELPEVESVAQFTRATSLIENGDNGFYEDGLFAQGQFFEVFSFRLLRGDPRTALTERNSIVLTQSLASKYFGEENPVGQTLVVSHSGWDFSGKNSMIVTGVMEDVPANSHFTFDYIVPASSSANISNMLDGWDGNVFLTYAALRSEDALPAFSAKLPALAQKHLGRLGYYQNNPDRLSIYYPQPLTDIHLRSHLIREFEANSDIKYVYLFSAIALLILLIACINYINLTTARSVMRTMEMGIRKVIGAQRKQLIGQFMSEAVIPSVFALLFAMLLVALLLPQINAVIGREISLNPSLNGAFLVLMIGVSLAVGLLAGTYPSLMMSSLPSISMMRGLPNRKAGKTRLRSALVIVQFTITIVLIIGAIVIQRQLAYIRDGSTGIDRDQVVSIEIKDQTLHERYSALKQTLQSHSDVLGVTIADSEPTYISRAGSVEGWEGAESGQHIQSYYSATQFGFLDVLGIELIEGRDLSPVFPTDESEGVLINETMKRQLGWDEAAGKRFRLGTGDGRFDVQVVGVVRDFNFFSLHQEIAPLVLYIGTTTHSYSRLLVKVLPDNMPETLAFLDETMAEFSPGYPLEYRFLDDAYNAMYRAEARLNSLFGYFTGISLFIACLGLLGLTTFAASQRTKEIGVRKVLGASVADILILLSRDFARMVFIAFVLAAPIGYFASIRWLQEFAYRISVGVGMFILVGAVVLSAALLTVSYRSMRAALTNPVNSLRYQ